MTKKKILAKLMVSAALAVSAPQLATAQSVPVHQFQIPAQDLGTALTELAQQSNQEIYFSSGLTRGKAAPAVVGRLSTNEALSKILAGSGLTYKASASGGITIRQQTATDPTQSRNRQEISGDAVLSGKVVDERTGASLDGARVEIDGSDRSTATDELGNFRISGLATGTIRLRISYLGYKEVVQEVELSQSGHPITVPMIGDVEGDIVIYGRRSARSQSINQERTAENSVTVLSSDYLGQFDGDTISEALRRAPGIAFSQDEITGDGANIIVRGLTPDLNTVTLNGVRLPEGSGTGRSADLGNILTESISKITVSKTLLPNQDSSGTGGLVEIETKGPLDRARRFASLNASAGRRGKDFGSDLLLSGTVSGKFGSKDQIGLSASLQLRSVDTQRISYTAGANPYFSEYLPLDADGNPINSTSFIPPETDFPFEPGATNIYPTGVGNALNGADVKNISGTLSGQWRLGDHTTLRLDYTHSREERDSYTRTTSFFANARRELRPVEALDGEVRSVLVSENYFDYLGVEGVFLSPYQQYTVEKDREEISDIVSFRGDSSIGKFDFNYTLGYANGRTITPYTALLNFQPDFFEGLNYPADPYLLDEARNNTTGDGLIISPFAPRNGDGYPLPLITQEGFDFYSDASRYYLQPSSITAGTRGRNERLTANLSSRFNIDSGVARYIEVGAFYEDAEFGSPPYVGDGLFSVSGTVPASELGLEFTDNSLNEIGLDGGIRVLPQDVVTAFLDGLPQLAESRADLVLTERGEGDPRRQETFTREKNLSAYVQSRFDFGKLEAVAGVRFDYVDIQARNLSGASVIDENFVYDNDFYLSSQTLVNQSAEEINVLPRLALTYRANDNFQMRFGYAKSVARPQIQNLSAQQGIGLILAPIGGPRGDQPQLQVNLGNPELEPAKTHNFDVSAEYYFEDVGQLKASIFLKNIRNTLELNSRVGLDSLEGVQLPDDPRFQDLPDNIAILVNKPVNSEDAARIWGIELAAEKNLTFLPSPLDGLGIYLNYTYTNSSKVQPLTYYDADTLSLEETRFSGVPFADDPKHSGTAALTYSKYGIDATLSYTAQDRRLATFKSFGLHSYQEADSSLDARIEYRFNRLGNWRVYFEGSDLLKGTNDPDGLRSDGGIRDVPRYYTSANYYGGRTLRAGIGVTF